MGRELPPIPKGMDREKRDKLRRAQDLERRINDLEALRPERRVAILEASRAGATYAELKLYLGVSEATIEKTIRQARQETADPEMAAPLAKSRGKRELADQIG